MEREDGESRAALREMMLPGWNPRQREQSDPPPLTRPPRLPRVIRLTALVIKS